MVGKFGKNHLKRGIKKSITAALSLLSFEIKPQIVIFQAEGHNIAVGADSFGVPSRGLAVRVDQAAEAEAAERNDAVPAAEKLENRLHQVLRAGWQFFFCFTLFKGWQPAFLVKTLKTQ